MRFHAATVLFLTLVPAASFAQEAPRVAAFEVASIKPNASNDHRMSMRVGPGGEIIAENFTLRRLIMFAYDVKGYSLVGPDFLDSVSYDITAKPPAKSERKDLKPMMQTLLAERFKLEIHRETKTLTGYAMVVAKGGLKVKESPANDGPDGNGGGGRQEMRRGSITAERVAMKGLASMVAEQVGRPVVDMTELKGAYDLKLEFTPEDNSAPPDAPERPASEGGGPTIFTALQEQVGVRLQSQKVPVEVVIIDHIEKTPTEN